VKPFSISRINTDKGIFRIAGMWCAQSHRVDQLRVTSIEMMGSDGWVTLDQSHDDIIQLMADLHPAILLHLVGT
jgi:hypothetical protein